MTRRGWCLLVSASALSCEAYGLGKVPERTTFYEDKAGPELQNLYADMKTLFERTETCTNSLPCNGKDFEVLRIAANDPTWQVIRNDATGLPKYRIAKMWVGGKVRSTGACEIVMVEFDESNMGGSSWGEMVVGQMGYLDNRSPVSAASFKRPIPAKCDVFNSADNPAAAASGGGSDAAASAGASAAKRDSSSSATSDDVADILGDLDDSAPPECRRYARQTCNKPGIPTANRAKFCKGVVQNVNKMVAKGNAAKACATMLKNSAD